MKVFMIGGTGLIGSEVAKELIYRGHDVVSVALPPLPEGAVLPEKMEIQYGNYLEMSDEEIRKNMEGCEGFVFAAGVDERVEGPAPIYELYKKYNIDPMYRLLKIAKECGVKHVAICGSYFSYFAKTKPELELTKWHPYIRSRIDQEKAAMSFADDDFSVAVLELPYIFGTQPGRKPVWVFLVEQVMGMKKATMYPKGGSTMVTVKQVGQAIAGAIERNRGGKKLMKEHKKNNIEGGLHMVKFTKLQCRNLFIDKSEGCDKLGVQPDDIDVAIGDSILLSNSIIEGKTQVIGMKGE